MTPPPTSVWLVASYSLLLLVIAWGFDYMARQTARRSSTWRTGKFTYHENHDAWLCPEDQWLWPTSFDPENRVMRYRALPIVCNSCPVKDTCTKSDTGREVNREIDQWPHSETGRFHRGISCSIAALAILMPLAMIIGKHSTADLLVLLTTVLVVVVGSFPLARHLWSTPSNFPEHLPQRTGQEEAAEAAIDKYSTQWGSPKKEIETQ